MKHDHFYWHRRAQVSVAQNYLTSSKRPEALIKGVTPTHCKGGRGAYLIDMDGKRYLDFLGAGGTNLLGYGNERVNTAIVEQVFHGYSHSLATYLEIETAEKVKELFPFVDTVKFFKSGEEALSWAIQAARQFSTEPVTVKPSERLNELNALREGANRSLSHLIFDERESGFRFPKYSVSGYTGVIPDFIVLGGALANGMPLAAVGAKAHLMNFGASTPSPFDGETLSLAAAKATMTLLQTKLDLSWLWEKGQAFMDWFNRLWPGELTIEGFPTMGSLVGERATVALFMQEASKAGLLFGPRYFFNFPMAGEIENAKGTIEAIVCKIKGGGVVLEGEPPFSTKEKAL